MNWRLAIAVFTMIAVTAISCKDDEPADDGGDNPVPQTKREMLIFGQWMMQSGVIEPAVKVEVFGATVTIASYYDLLAAINGGDAGECQKDNLMLFQQDSTVQLDEGKTKCDPADPQVQEGGGWELLNNDTELAFTSFPFDPLQEERVLRVNELTASDLKLEMDYRFEPPTGGDTTDHVIKLNFVNSAQ